MNSRLRSISFFLDCSLSSCLLASCVAVASSSFCNTNAQLFYFAKKRPAHFIILLLSFIIISTIVIQNNKTEAAFSDDTADSLTHLASCRPILLQLNLANMLQQQRQRAEPQNQCPTGSLICYQRKQFLEPFSLSVNQLPLCRA